MKRHACKHAEPIRSLVLEVLGLVGTCFLHNFQPNTIHGLMTHNLNHEPPYCPNPMSTLFPLCYYLITTVTTALNAATTTPTRLTTPITITIRHHHRPRAPLQSPSSPQLQQPKPRPNRVVKLSPCTLIGFRALAFWCLYGSFQDSFRVSSGVP